MFEQLKDVPRLLMRVDLKPVQGERFQPTGFADLGAATYERPDGTRMLLVESAQSMANRLEQTCLKANGPDLVPELAGIPYVVATLTGNIDGGTLETRTSSLIEAHRLNSPFIISDESFAEDFSSRAGYAVGRPIDWRRAGSAVFFFDPNSLLHGLFMANLGDGRLKFPRALTGFIEAEDAREAHSGGVKNNPTDPTGTIRAINFDKDVYSNVPYHRVEFTASRITAYFNLDLALLRGYALPEAATQLLIALGLYKVRRLLSAGLRLRTACDLTPQGEIRADAPVDFLPPPFADLLEALGRNIEECHRQKLFADPPVTKITIKVKQAKKKAESAEPEESTESKEPNE